MAWPDGKALGAVGVGVCRGGWRGHSAGEKKHEGPADVTARQRAMSCRYSSLTVDAQTLKAKKAFKQVHISQGLGNKLINMKQEVAQFALAKSWEERSDDCRLWT